MLSMCKKKCFLTIQVVLIDIMCHVGLMITNKFPWYENHEPIKAKLHIKMEWKKTKQNSCTDKR